MLDQITPLILTFNEEPNIGRVLERLTWAKKVVVLDSGSTDRTREIATAFPNVQWETRAFDTHSRQWDHALNHCGVESQWVLALDADYVLTRELIEEISRLNPGDGVEGYRTHFRYLIYGKPLKRCFYPPVVTLFLKAKGKYVQDGHTQRIRVDGLILDLSHKIDHDDRKPVSRWLNSQSRYADLEVELLLSQSWSQLRWSNRVRKGIVVAPWLAPFLYWTVGLGFLDGWEGIAYAFQRCVAESIISMKLLEHHFQKKQIKG